MHCARLALVILGLFAAGCEKEEHRVPLLAEGAWRKAPTIATLLLAWSVPLDATGDGQAPALRTAPGEATPAAARGAATPRLHLGKVYEIDRKAREIVITHGDLPEFGMTPMTMGFRVKEARLLDKVRPGDKVRFRAQLVDGVITLTGIERLR
jgi:Cu(I)/Ag(I) efflux system protein CusF